jgi:hypothetical protein
LSSDPDRSRLDRRIGLSVFGATGFCAAQSTALPSNLGGPGYSRADRVSPSPFAGLELWSEAHVGRFDDDVAQADRSGDFEVLYLGGDLLVARNILVGALVQFDWMRDSSDALNGNIDGRGWMIGPYVGIQLDPTWQFNARAAWGQSSNDIDIGANTGSFDTDRWLARGSLRGNWFAGAWRLTSITDLAYVEERQKSFTESGGAIIPGQTVALGRLSFGPEIAYRFAFADHSFFEPQLSLQGLWNFEREQRIVLSGIVDDPNAVSARIEAGAMFGYLNGVTFRATGAYEGLGSDDFNAWSARVWGAVPLN